MLLTLDLELCASAIGILERRMLGLEAVGFDLEGKGGVRGPLTGGDEQWEDFEGFDERSEYQGE